MYCTQFWKTMIYGLKLTAYSDRGSQPKQRFAKESSRQMATRQMAPLEYMFESLSVKIMTKTTT